MRDYGIRACLGYGVQVIIFFCQVLFALCMLNGHLPVTRNHTLHLRDNC